MHSGQSSSLMACSRLGIVSQSTFPIRSLMTIADCLGRIEFRAIWAAPTPDAPLSARVQTRLGVEARLAPDADVFRVRAARRQVPEKRSRSFLDSLPAGTNTPPRFVCPLPSRNRGSPIHCSSDSARSDERPAVSNICAPPESVRSDVHRPPKTTSVFHLPSSSSPTVRRACVGFPWPDSSGRIAEPRTCGIAPPPRGHPRSPADPPTLRAIIQLKQRRRPKPNCPSICAAVSCLRAASRAAKSRSLQFSNPTATICPIPTRSKCCRFGISAFA